MGHQTKLSFCSRVQVKFLFTCPSNNGQAVRALGFSGEVNLPSAKSTPNSRRSPTNRGYGFLNFKDKADADDFAAAFEAFSFPYSMKRVVVKDAYFQGPRYGRYCYWIVTHMNELLHVRICQQSLSSLFLLCVFAGPSMSQRSIYQASRLHVSAHCTLSMHFTTCCLSAFTSCRLGWSSTTACVLSLTTYRHSSHRICCSELCFGPFFVVPLQKKMGPVVEKWCPIIRRYVP